MASAGQHIKDLFTMPVSWAWNCVKSMAPYALFGGLLGIGAGVMGVFVGPAVWDLVYHLEQAVGLDLGAADGLSYLLSQGGEHNAVFLGGWGAAMGGGYGFVKGSRDTLDHYAVRPTQIRRVPARDLTPQVSQSRVPAKAYARQAEPMDSGKEQGGSRPSKRIVAGSARYDNKMTNAELDIAAAR